MMPAVFPSRVLSPEEPGGFKPLPGLALWSQRAPVPSPTALTLLTNNKISAPESLKKRLCVPFLESMPVKGRGNYIKDAEKYQILCQLYQLHRTEYSKCLFLAVD